MADTMQNKRVLITGANSGIGYVAAETLAGMGAEVVLACRRPEAALDACNQIRKAYPAAKLDTLTLDLSSLESVRKAALVVREKWPELDVLVNNAGIASMKRKTSVDGFELTFATNHLGPFLFTQLILPTLKAPGGRIVNVASTAHHQGHMHFDDLNLKKGYRVFKAYSQSKLANILFTRELATRLEAKGITVNCLHPGAVKTNIWPGDHWYEKLASAAIKLFLITPEEGAKTTVWLASSDAAADKTGGYFYRCRKAKISREASDDNIARRLWDLSVEWTGLPTDVAETR